MTHTVTQEVTGDGTLPKGWARADLGEILDVVRGISFPSSVKKFKPEDGYIACLRTTNVQRDVKWDDLWFVPEEHLKREEQRVKPLDILISTANSYELVGKVAQVHQMPFKATLGAFISLIRVPTQLDAKYFYFSLVSNETQSRIRGLASTTTNISNVSTTKLKMLALKVPPLNEQRRIVEKIEELFTKLDAGVRSLEQARAQLKSYRRSVLKAAVEGELSREWREAHMDEVEPASELLERILQERREMFAGKKYKEPASPDTSKLPTLPDGWKWTNLDQLGEVIGGLTKNRKRESYPIKLPYLRVANVYANELRLDDVERIGVDKSEINRVLLKHEDLLVVEGNGSPDQIGRVARWDGSISPCAHQNHLIKVRFIEPDMSRFALQWLLSPSGREHIKAVASSTSGLYTLSLSKVKALPLPLPPINEQRVIVEEVERRLSVVDKLEATVEENLKRANALRQSILTLAFSGELVPQNPDDEPASALLERIRAEREAARFKGRKKDGGTKLKTKAGEWVPELFPRQGG